MNRLIRAGRSFSGRERNCCFLNTGGARFATVSGAVDLNLPDDSRGLALTDWDGDGRVDLWLTNRTGPRVRFLKNEYDADHHYLALQLQGTRSNRDAIGARVEVYLANQPRPLLKTLYGGSGYIAQSSKALHFGLGRATQIDRVIVRWPGGNVETIANPLQVDQRYRIVEGTAEAIALAVSRRGPWKANMAAESPLPRTDRVVLLQPAPLPHHLQVRSLDGQAHPLVRTVTGSRGTVINLWATWCTNCLEELGDWSRDQQRFQDAGLHVINLCVDQPTEDAAADLARITEMVGRLQLPFEVAVSDPSVVETLNVFQRAFIGRQTDLPLPSSFLVDSSGQLAVIYKGPAEASQIIADSQVLGASPTAIFDVAIPFPGQWLERPPTTSARMAAVAMLEHGYSDAAESYARQLLDRHPNPADHTESTESASDDQVSLRHMLGAILFDRQTYDEARIQYEASLKLAPHHRDIRQELARTYVRLNQLPQACQQLVVLLQEQPENAELLAELGRLHARQQQWTLAVESLRRSLRVQPRADVRFELANALRDDKQYAAARDEYRAVMVDVRSPVVMNNLAWLLATATDATVRDGTEATQLARQATAATHRSAPKILGTLAAAHAESGQFEEAIRVLDEALRLAEKQEASLVSELQQRRLEYERRQPTRQ